MQHSNLFGFNIVLLLNYAKTIICFILIYFIFVENLAKSYFLIFKILFL